MKKRKYYVVWKGVLPGIYDTWEKCKIQVAGFQGAQYKSFATQDEAEAAFLENPWKYFSKKKSGTAFEIGALPNEIVKESLAVDAACSGNPGKMEYRGVWVNDGLEMFRVGPYEAGTNNIGEFLAIVHALALLKNDEKDTPIYTDSLNAMKWVQKKRCNTKLARSAKNKPIFELIARAEKWLQENNYTTKILKWNTQNWGEIPADFGRK